MDLYYLNWRDPSIVSIDVVVRLTEGRGPALMAGVAEVVNMIELFGIPENHRIQVGRDDEAFMAHLAALDARDVSFWAVGDGTPVFHMSVIARLTGRRALVELLAGKVVEKMSRPMDVGTWAFQTTLANPDIGLDALDSLTSDEEDDVRCCYMGGFKYAKPGKVQQALELLPVAEAQGVLVIPLAPNKVTLEYKVSDDPEAILYRVVRRVRDDELDDIPQPLWDLLGHPDLVVTSDENEAVALMADFFSNGQVRVMPSLEDCRSFALTIRYAWPEGSMYTYQLLKVGG